MGIPRWFVSRRAAAGVVGALSIAGVLLDVAWLAGIGLLVLGAVAVMPQPHLRANWLSDLLAWLPVGAGIAVGATTVVVALGAVTGQPIWGAGRAMVTLLLLIAGMAAPSVIRGGRIAVWSPLSVVAWAPAVALGAVGVFRMVQPMSYWSRPAWAVTDWMNNAEMTVDLVKNGLLEHTSASQSAGGAPTVYPRGLHALIAWLVTGATPSDGLPAVWEAVLAALFGAMAVIGVLALASAGLLAIAVARRLGAPRAVVVTASLLAALLLLHPQAYLLLGPSGFMTTAAGVVILYGLMLVADAGPARRGFALRLMLAFVLLTATVHVWQLLAIPVAGVTAYLAWRWWREGRPRLAVVVPVAVVSVLACVPLGLVTIAGGGADQAALEGSFEPLRAITAVVVVAVALGVLAARRAVVGSLGPALATGIVVLLVLGVGLVVALGGGPGDIPYYAGKVLWHATVLALPAFTAGSTYLVWRVYASVRLRRAVGERPLVRGLVVGAPLVLLLAYVGGGLSYGLLINLRGLPSTGGASPQVPMVVLADEAARNVAGRAAVVYLLHPQGWHLWLRHEDWHASQILRTLGATVPKANSLVGHRATEVCEFLRQHPDALRITGPRHGDAELVERGCPAEVVRPSEWRVLTTPAAWWQGTQWEALGGAPDPALKPETLLFGDPPPDTAK